MIVSNSLMRRRQDISLADFRSHWLDPHGPLTAMLPGTRRYVQNHVMDSAGTNRLARDLRIDGFAQLAFISPEARVTAHSSAELKACDQDSPQFIGAVSRVITESLGEEVRTEADRLVKQIVLTVSGAAAGDDLAILDQLEGAHGIVHHRIIQQAPAPNSVVPFIGIEIGSFAELWVAPEALPRNAARLEREAPLLATFAVEVHSFI
jgi:uncharacterized protein (TIGR02118 family)